MMCRYHRGLGSGCRYHRGIPNGCHYYRGFPMSINIQRKKISFYFKLSFFVCWFCVNLLGELMMIWFHCWSFILTLELFNGSCGGSTMLNNYLHISSWCSMIDRTGLPTIILYFLYEVVLICTPFSSTSDLGSPPYSSHILYYRFSFSCHVVVLCSNDIKGFFRCVFISLFDDDVNVNRLSRICLFSHLIGLKAHLEIFCTNCVELKNCAVNFVTMSSLSSLHCIIMCYDHGKKNRNLHIVLLLGYFRFHNP